VSGTLTRRADRVAGTQRKDGLAEGGHRTGTVSAVSAHGLNKAFGRRKALRDLSLQLEQGTRLAVIGPNGAGKSTLIRLLAMLCRPTSGTLDMFGFDAAAEAEHIRALVGVVLHESLLYAELTVAENLAFAARLYSVPHPRERVSELIERLELGPFERTQVRRLSRGQRQRTSLARALIHAPPLLLLDEPDTGLDARAFERFQRDLSRERERTVIFTSHRPEHACELATRILLLREGYGNDLGDASRWRADEIAGVLLEAGGGEASQL
jgi:heme exporter protein A